MQSVPDSFQNISRGNDINLAHEDAWTNKSRKKGCVPWRVPDRRSSRRRAVGALHGEAVAPEDALRRGHCLDRLVLLEVLEHLRVESEGLPSLADNGSWP